MLKWSVIFLILAIIAAFLGFTGISGAAVEIAKFLFFAYCINNFLINDKQMGLKL